MTVETSYTQSTLENPLPVLPKTRDRQVARWVSNIASPPILAISGTMICAAQIVGHTTPGQIPMASTIWEWAGFIIFLSVILPVCFVFTMLKRGKVTDFDVYHRQQRFWPYIVSLVCASSTWLALAVGHAPRLFTVLQGAAVGQGMVMFLVNQRWKISAHAAGTSSMAVVIWQVLGPASTPVLLIIPIVAWSRVRLGRHSLLQVLAGSILGISIFLGALAIYF